MIPKMKNFEVENYLKLKNGEVGTFIFPSYKAYGIYGDSNKIPANTPIICTIKVKSINSTQN